MFLSQAGSSNSFRWYGFGEWLKETKKVAGWLTNSAYYSSMGHMSETIWSRGLGQKHSIDFFFSFGKVHCKKLKNAYFWAEMSQNAAYGLVNP